MGAVTSNGTLLVGTNTFAILTQSITDWVNFRDTDEALAIEGQTDFEESKIDYQDRDDILEG